MKLERSDTWARTFKNGAPVWRVVDCGRLAIGPWCYSRTDAIWQWFKCNLSDKLSERWEGYWLGFIGGVCCTLAVAAILHLLIS